MLPVKAPVLPVTRRKGLNLLLAIGLAQGESFASLGARLGLSDGAIARRAAALGPKVEELRQRLTDRALGLLTAEACKSVQRLALERDCPQNSASDRIKAAQVLLDKLLSFRPPAPAPGAQADPRTQALAGLTADVFSRLVLSVREREVSLTALPAPACDHAPAPPAPPPP